MKKVAVLRSSHMEVAKIDANKIEWVYASGDIDFIKVIEESGKQHWCDEIEIIIEY